jgi:hypothetical protein
VSEILLEEPLPIRVCSANIVAEGVRKKMSLVSQTQEAPVFVLKIGEEGLPFANIVNILHSEDVQFIGIGVRVLTILCLITAIFLPLAEHLYDGLPLSLLLLPLFVRLLPCCPLGLKPF